VHYHVKIIISVFRVESLFFIIIFVLGVLRAQMMMSHAIIFFSLCCFLPSPFSNYSGLKMSLGTVHHQIITFLLPQFIFILLSMPSQDLRTRSLSFLNFFSDVPCTQYACQSKFFFFYHCYPLPIYPIILTSLLRIVCYINFFTFLFLTCGTL